MFTFNVSDPPKPTKDISSNTVIDSQPVVHDKEVEIKPSKTEISNEIKKSEKISTVVQVKSSVPPPAVLTKIEVKSSPQTKINVVEGKSNVVSPQSQIVSKVQVSN